VKAREVIGVVVLTAVVAGLGWWWQRGAPETMGLPSVGATTGADAGALVQSLKADGPLDPGVLAALEALEGQLAEQAQEQRALRRELDTLRGQLYVAETLPDDTSSTEEAEADATEADAPPNGGRWGRTRATREGLLEAGFSAAETEDILATADRLDMERLDLQYQARREGWLRTPKFIEAMRELPSLRDALVDDYGDSGYDRYLYATGRPNRLVVNEVIRESPAAAVGLQTGDQVIALAGERIYSERDLMRVASEGSAGELIPAVVERGGSRFEVYLPRGPLGVRTGRSSVPPPAR